MRENLNELLIRIKRATSLYSVPKYSNYLLRCLSTERNRIIRRHGSIYIVGDFNKYVLLIYIELHPQKIGLQNLTIL